MNQKGNTFLYLLIGALILIVVGFYLKTQLKSSMSENYGTTTNSAPIFKK